MALGLYDLGLAPAVFWSLTMRELDVLWKRHLAAEERRDRRVALLATMYANAHRDEKKKLSPYELEDFMPRRPTPDAVADPRADRGAGPYRTQTVAQQIAMLRDFTEAIKARKHG